MKRRPPHDGGLYSRISFLRRIIWALVLFAFSSGTIIIIARRSDISTKPVGWEKSFFISPANVPARNVGTASRGRLTAVVYEGDSDGKRGVYVSISFNEGGRFLTPVKIMETVSRIDLNPHIGISHEGVITVAWHELVEKSLTNRIFISSSRDFGATWKKPEQVRIDYDFEMLPRIYYDHRGDLHLFFHGFNAQGFNLFHAVSEDGIRFKTTGPIIKLTHNMKGAFFPAIALSQNFIYLVWQGKTSDFTDDLFFMRSSNNGRSWSSSTRITASKANDASPSILLHNDTLYVVYRNSDDKNWAVKMLKGFLYGEKWETKPTPISKTNADCFAPRIAEYKNELYIVWYDTREENPNIFLRKYSVKENLLSEEMKISQGTGASKNPSFISLEDKVVLLWEEGSRIIAKFNDVHAAPPVVFSRTHPDGAWSRNPVAVIEWTPPDDESGIVGYATIIGKGEAKDINPTIQNVKGDQFRRVIPDLPDGITYFHIRSIDGAGNYSRTIHYKIQVSANPLPMPVVVSPTHPQGKAVEMPSPEFRWALDDTDRLKGFLYSLSKDIVTKPDAFMTKFEINFDGLEEGKYFFSLVAVDKTNMSSSVAVYPFIIGSSGIIDPEDLKKIARKDMKIEEKKEPPVVLPPEIEIVFPFDLKNPCNRDAFKAIIVPKHIPKNDIIGYSMEIDTVSRDLPDRINLKSHIISIENLKDGRYVLSARAKYQRMAAGGTETAWTKPFTAEFTVKLPMDLSPVEYYARALMEKLKGKGGILFILLTGAALLFLLMGYGGRVVFVSRLINYRIRSYLRIFLKG